MSIYLLCLLIGVVAGLRTLTAPAAVAWGAWLGWLPLAGTWSGFMGHWLAVAILTVLAVAELVADQLPSTPNRKLPPQFSARIVSGAFCGTVIGTIASIVFGGMAAGVIGAILGTLGGAEARARLTKFFGQDQPAAFVEDAVAIAGAFWIVSTVT